MTHTTTSDATPSAVDDRSWSELLVAALFVLPAVLVAVMVLNEVVIPPLVVFSAVFVVLGIALRRGAGTRARYAAAAFGVLVVAGNLPFLLADFSHPESPVGFIPTLAATLGGLTVAAAAVISTRPTPPRGARVTAGAVVAALLVGSIGSGLAYLGLDDDSRRDGDVVVAATNGEYPERIEVPQGTEAVFVENHDIYRHTFTVEGTGIDRELPGSTDRRIELDLQPGTYRYFCDVPGHGDMEGTLVVG